MSHTDAEPLGTEEIDLKNRALAALLAWLVPGLGHLYQGRTAKGLTFMICILSTFIYGLFLGQGRCVYASWQGQEKHLPFLCQIGVGVPAFPALVQSMRVRQHKEPLPVFDYITKDFMAPPVLSHATIALLPPDKRPPLGFRAGSKTQSDLKRELHRFFELGTVFTMIAGLLNVLVIFDAWSGPFYLVVQKEEDGQ